MEVSAKEVLKDLVELCSGVQHPTRGLFLRTYLSEMTKDKLPDEGGKYDGDVTDSIDFIVKNFTEMNKLWVRMQHGVGLVRDPTRREEERIDLNTLVCKNLDRLSHLDGLTIGLYRSDVLPRVLQQVVSCQDKIAQQYLMETLVQAYSDDFHLRTLDKILETCCQLVPEVNVHAIVTALILRLATYIEQNPQARNIPETDLFTIFFTFVQNFSKEQNNSLPSVLELTNALLKFTLRIFPDEFDKIDSVFQFVHTCMSDKSFKGNNYKDSVNEIMDLLKAPPTCYKSVLPILKIANFIPVIDLLSREDKKTISKYFVDSFLSSEDKISNADQVDMFLKFISVLVLADPSTDGDIDNDYTWEEDQTKISYTISKFVNEDAEEMLSMLVKAKTHFLEGGKIRMKYTIVPLVFKSLLLVQTVYKNKDTDEAWEMKAKSIFKFTNDLVKSLKSADYLDIAYRLYLECALSAGICGLGAFSHSFITKGALQMYEEDQMSKANEYNALRLLIATINQIQCFDREQISKLSKKIAGLSTKLQTTDAQARAVTATAHLFKSKIVPDSEGDEFRDNSFLLTCLKKSFSIASECTETETMVTLIIEALDDFLYFYSIYSGVVEAKHVTIVISKIKSLFQAKNPEKDQLQYVKNLKAYISFKQVPKNIAKSILENLEAEYYVKNPLPTKGVSQQDRDKLKDKVRKEHMPEAEKIAKETAERWQQISF